MERRVSLSKGVVVVLFAVAVNLWYYLGIVSALELCAAAVLHLLYFVCLSAVVIAFVVSISYAVWACPGEMKEAKEDKRQARISSGSLRDSFMISVAAALVVLFGGHVFALLFGVIGDWCAGYVDVMFPAAEFFRFENTFPAFWRPFLIAHGISLLLALLLWCDRTCCTYKRKRRKNKQVVG